MPSYGASGAWANTALTSLAVPYPAGVTASQMLVTFIAGRYSNSSVTTLTGWLSRTDQGAAGNGGTGTNALNTGTSKARIFSKQADGSETGSATWAVSGNNFQAVTSRFTKTAGNSWDILGAVGIDTTLGTAYSATAATALTLQPGDILVAISLIAADTPTFSGQGFTAAGITFGAGTIDVADSASVQGSHQRAGIYRATVTAGTATVAPTFAMTLSGADSGCTAFVRLREIPPPQTVAITRAAETDTAQAATAAKTEAVTAAGEADTAHPLGEAKQAATSRATETDTARGVTAAKAAPSGRAGEADTARPATALKGEAAGRATETDAAQGITFTSADPITAAAEHDTATPTLAVKAGIAGRATEQDATHPATAAKTATVTAATETDTAQDTGVSETPTVPGLLTATGQTAVLATSAAPTSQLEVSSA